MTAFQSSHHNSVESTYYLASKSKIIPLNIESQFCVLTQWIRHSIMNHGNRLNDRAQPKRNVGLIVGGESGSRKPSTWILLPMVILYLIYENFLFYSQ